MKKNAVPFGIIFTAYAVIAFFWWLIRYLQMDFWGDEIVSLQYFIFVPLEKILTDYSVPNNHIFCNILNHLFIRLFSIPNIDAVLSHPLWLRGLMGVYVIITLVYLYRTAAKFFNHTVAAAAVILILTTVPYYNFAVQLRGYSLSMALTAMLLFYTWSYTQTPRWTYGSMLVISSSLLLYTLPSNVYWVVTLILLYAFLGALSLFSARAPGPESSLLSRAVGNPDIQTAFLLASSGLVSLLLYAPVIGVLFQVAGSAPLSGPNLNTLFHLLPKSLDYFTSLRYALIPLAGIGAVLFVLKLKNKSPDPFSRYGLICLYLLCMPFLLSSVRGDSPFDRFFIYETLVFALFLAAASYDCVRLLPFSNRVKTPLFLLALLVYAQLSFALALEKRDQRILADLSNSSKSQDIFNNYYQSRYAPLELAKMIAPLKAQWPVYVYETFDSASLLAYLRIFQVDYTDLHEPSALQTNSNNRAIVITTSQDKFQAEIARAASLRCDPLNQDTFFSVFSCQRTSVP